MLNFIGSYSNDRCQFTVIMMLFLEREFWNQGYLRFF